MQAYSVWKETQAQQHYPQINPEEYLKTNIHGTIKVLEAARYNKVSVNLSNLIFLFFSK